MRRHHDLVACQRDHRARRDRLLIDERDHVHVGLCADESRNIEARRHQPAVGIDLEDNRSGTQLPCLIEAADEGVAVEVVDLPGQEDDDRFVIGLRGWGSEPALPVASEAKVTVKIKAQIPVSFICISYG